jgi:GNAT superfamily N-acetyltransferase
MIAIREATPEDAAFIPRLTIAAWQRAYVGIFTPELLAALAEPDRVKERVDLTRGRLEERPPGMAEFVAELDGDVIGWVRVVAATEAEIEACYVHPDAWGRGVGRTLLEAGVQALLDCGCRELLLWTLERNDRSRRFYEGQGWLHDGTVRSREFSVGEVSETAEEVRYVRSG